MTRGILMFAHDNGLFQYGKMAHASARAARWHLDCPVALVTDEDTWKAMPASAFMTFAEVLFVEKDDLNKRHFDMADGSTKKAKYHNTTRLRAYDLTPFEETLVLDTDVLVQDDALRGVWGGPPIQMNTKIAELVKEAHGNTTTKQRLEERSLEVFWATIMYFRKDPMVNQFFEVARYVEANYDYYAVLYGFASTLRRVDFIYTIAAHLMSGYMEKARGVVASLPTPSTLFAWNRDVMVDVTRNSATFVTKFHGREFPVVTSQTVHCMNKDSMLAHADKIIECYE